MALNPKYPVFRRLATLVKAPYRVFFSTKKEMAAWLGARGWEPVSENRLAPDSVEEWRHEAWDSRFLKFKKAIFDGNGRLRRYTVDEWDDEWIEMASALTDFTEDDIPF